MSLPLPRALARALAFFLAPLLLAPFALAQQLWRSFAARLQRKAPRNSSPFSKFRKAASSFKPATPGNKMARPFASMAFNPAFAEPFSPIPPAPNSIAAKRPSPISPRSFATPNPVAPPSRKPHRRP